MTTHMSAAHNKDAESKFRTDKRAKRTSSQVLCQLQRLPLFSSSIARTHIDFHRRVLCTRRRKLRQNPLVILIKHNYSGPPMFHCSQQQSEIVTATDKKIAGLEQQLKHKP